ncbi:hypothetical protein [Butyrivibrio sp. YAB3001]|uniref:hypothetical protein n=1 Tax=Butyrivibrio sp. YAB3001 TaxID=1520812 RepID=UPI0015882835|nr:hypothetical protein [Butyrivibrio sp. YAB3001]
MNLTDDVIELLKSGVINNRLLGEMICHPEFRKFMADTEIFVDGIASQSIQSINAYADTLRRSKHYKQAINSKKNKKKHK